MKMEWCLTSLLLLVLCAGVQLHAQQSDTNSVESIKAKAENGDTSAQFELGNVYLGGKGVEQNTAEALRWYRKAAEQGNASAQAALGSLYFSGQGGVAVDPVESFKWMSKAAIQGHAVAQFFVGQAYAHGLGVPKDEGEAIKWYRRAANQNNAEAQDILGYCYANGIGVERNFVEACKWEILASAQRNEEATRNLTAFENLMTVDQISEAKKLTAAFVPQKETQGTNSSSNPPVAAGFPIASGTGFFITEDGYLISNYHVVKDASQIRLATSAGTIPAKVVQADAANDLALLKADGHFAPLAVISSRGMKLGGTVATVGFPDIGLQGFAPKLAKGEITALSGAGDDARYFQISAPVQPGNSGGALVDAAGNVVGIVSAKLDAATALAASGALPENVNYAVKSSFLLSFLESVPDVSAKLKVPNTKEEKFEDVVKSAQDAAVLVLVY